LCDFLSKAEQYGLGKIAKTILEKKLSPEEMNCKNNDFEALLKRVDEAPSLSVLHEAVKDISHFLGIETIPDTERLISYQGFTKGHVQKKLSQLLLSVDPHHLSENASASDRAELLSILELAWITDPDEMNYYVQEFDLHAKNKLSNKVKESAVKETVEEAPISTLTETLAPAPKIRALGKPIAKE